MRKYFVITTKKIYKYTQKILMLSKSDIIYGHKKSFTEKLKHICGINNFFVKFPT